MNFDCIFFLEKDQSGDVLRPVNHVITYSLFEEKATKNATKANLLLLVASSRCPPSREEGLYQATVLLVKRWSSTDKVTIVFIIIFIITYDWCS